MFPWENHTEVIKNYPYRSYRDWYRDGHKKYTHVVEKNNI